MKWMEYATEDLDMDIIFKENVEIGNQKKDEEPCSTKEFEES
jgi:hypothetical protein